jgi:hypothetical protein
MMKKIYAFHWDCGRMGDLDGIFVAESVDVDALIGKNIYFGEVLGKHSEISGPLEASDLTVRSDDPDFVARFVEVMGHGTITGFNPLDYYDPEEEE